MKKNTVTWICAVATLLLCGCTSPRWQISKAEYSYRSKENPDDEYSVQNTILLDTRTGKTWIMSPSDDPGTDYYWVELRERPAPEQ